MVSFLLYLCQVMKNICPNFGLNVRKRREELGLTQEQLANKMQKDAREIRVIEAGQRNVTIKTLYKLCDALKISASELLTF